MSNRFYYTDPLAAAWMALQFSMIFVDHLIECFRCSEWASIDQLTRLHSPVDGFQRVYISRDSLQLLIPVPGDLIRAVDTNHDYIVYRIFKEGDDAGIWQEDWFKIILRDGKPFHWPEIEFSA